MTMLDDDRLAALLNQAATTFEVPAAGPAAILDMAAGRTLLPGHDGAGAGVVDGRGDEGGDSAGTGEGERTDADRAAPPAGHRRRLTGLAGRHRVLTVAACLVVLVLLAGVVGALTRGPTRPTQTAAVAHSGVKAPAHGGVHSGAGTAATTTTTPAAKSLLPGAANGEAAAPFSPSSSGAQGLSKATPTTAPPLPTGSVGQPAKIEQTGSLTLTVGRGRLGRTITQLTALAGTAGGFVANSQTQSGASTDGAPSGSVTLQVPVQNFASVLKSAEALGTTSGLTTKASDVTGQYVDLQSRITALQDTRQQYLSILAKATTVGDVLAVQEQVDAIQTQIEQLQGQLNLLTSQTTYSTLTVSVDERTQTPALRQPAVPESGLVRAWHASVGGFVTGVEGLIRLAGPVLFALLLLAAVLIGGRTAWRRYRRHSL